MHHFHAVLWIDHREAKIYEFSPDDLQKFVIRSDSDPSRHLHHKSGSIGSGHAGEDKSFLAGVAKGLESVGEVLVVGPGNAKTAFADYVKSHDHAVAAKIVGVETVDHPTDGQVVAFARKYFISKDRMQPQQAHSKPS